MTDTPPRPAPRIEVHVDAADLATSAAGELITRLEDAQARGEEPHIGLTGGSIAKAMHTLCSSYSPGNTDLAWTRLTPWRALLASALDQYETPATSASVTAERISPSADLLVSWRADRLKVKVSRHSSKGPGITEVVLETKQGPIRITRRDGKLATISSPDRPDRPIALKRLGVPALLAEELRRLDEDDVYAGVARSFAKKRLS